MFKKIKNQIVCWLEYHRFYAVKLQSPIVFQERTKIRPGHVVVFKSRDLEIDREKKIKEEEAEKNPPHPAEE